MIIINLVKSGALVITGLVATRASDLFFKRKALEKKIGDYIKYPVDLTRIKKECTGVKRSLNPCFKISKWQKNRILKEKQLYELFLAYGPFIYKYGGFDMMQESIKKFDKALNRYKPMEFNPQPSTPTSTTNKILRVSTTEQYIPNKRKLFNKKNKNAYAVRHKLNKEWIKKGQFGPFAYCKNKSEEKRPISCK